MPVGLRFEKGPQSFQEHGPFKDNQMISDRGNKVSSAPAVRI